LCSQTVADDTPWAKAQSTFQRPDVTFAEGNSEMLDFTLLSQCHNFMLSRGTFGWWAAYLSDTKGKVLYQNEFTGLRHQYSSNASDYYPSHWIKDNETPQVLKSDGVCLIKGAELQPENEEMQAQHMQSVVDFLARSSDLPANYAKTAETAAATVGVPVAGIHLLMQTSIWIVAPGTAAVGGLFVPDGTHEGRSQWAMTRDGHRFELFHQSGWWFIQEISAAGYYATVYKAKGQHDSPTPPSTGWLLGKSGLLPAPVAIGWSQLQKSDKQVWDTTYVSVHNVDNDWDIGRMLFQYASAHGIAKARGSKLILRNEAPILAKFQGPFASVQTAATPSAFKIQEAHFAAYDGLIFQARAQHIQVGEYLQNRRYFEDVEDEVRTLFQPQQVWMNLASSWLKRYELHNSTLTCIDIREMRFYQTHQPSFDWLARGMAQFVDSSKLLVFTDDPVWAAQIRMFRGTGVIIVEGNSPMLDFTLLSQCNNFLLTGGEFGWWAAYLSRTKARVVYANEFIGGDNEYKMNASDYYPPDWLQVNETFAVVSQIDSEILQQTSVSTHPEEQTRRESEVAHARVYQRFVDDLASTNTKGRAAMHKKEAIAVVVAAAADVAVADIPELTRTAIWVLGAGVTEASGMYVPNGTAGGLTQFKLTKKDGSEYMMYHMLREGKWVIRQITFSKDSQQRVYGFILYSAKRSEDSPMPSSTGWMMGPAGMLPVPTAISWSKSKELDTHVHNTTYVSVKFGRTGIGNALFKYAAAYGIAKARGSTLLLAESAGHRRWNTKRWDVWSQVKLDMFAGPLAPLVTDSTPEAFKIAELDHATYHDYMKTSSRYAQHVEVGLFLQNRKYWLHVEDEVREVLKIKPEWQTAAKAWRQEHSLDRSDMTCIHIRRGDMQKWEEFRMPSVTWYARQMKLFPSARILVFSG
jgi:hypothetical protein